MTKKRIKNTTIIAIVLGVLMLVSLVQTSQLIGIKTKMEGVSVNNVVERGSNDEKPSDTVLPSNIQNLPNMVGGC